MNIKHNTLQKFSIIFTMFSFLLLTPSVFDHVTMPIDEDVFLILTVWLISGINLIIRTKYLPKEVDDDIK